MSSAPPLLQACESSYGRSARLKLLLENGVDPNRVDSKGRTTPYIICLHYACDLCSNETLVENGANVNATNTKQRQERSFAVNIIGVAVQHTVDSVGVMKASLSAGASPNGLDKEGRPLIMTTCQSQPVVDEYGRGRDMVQVLLEAGADFHYRDELDRNLLHHASRPYSNNFLALKTLVI